MAKMRDITGQRFGKLVALYPTEKRQNRSVVWHCECDCGRIVDVTSGNLTSGNTKSCGCWKNKKDLTGKRFGKLTVLYPTEERQNGHVVWRCKCDCGTEKNIRSSSLTSGEIKSCGCLKKQPTVKKDLTGKRFGKLVVLHPTEERQNGHIVWHCKCDCGNIVNVSSGDLTRKTRNGTKSCGCITSKGEGKIVEILNELDIKYEKEKKFKDCVNPKTNWPLRFDFFLPDYNCCIEYDGQQHFQEWSRCDDTLADRQYRDNIKNNFCKEHNIQLIRIPYTEYDKINNDFILKLLE